MLVLFRQIVVGDTLFQELGLDFVVVVGHQYMILVHRRFVVVGIGGNTRLQLEEPVNIPVRICFRCSCQAHHDGVEIFKDRPVFLENTPVTFVNDDQIKMRRGEQAQSILALYIVDGVEHRRIGGEHDPGIPVILVGAKVAQGHIRKIVLKIILRLLDQRRPVCQKQNVRHRLAPAEHIRQTGCGAGFAGSGGHDQQMLPKAHSQLLADGTDGFFLIVAVGNLIVNGNCHQVLLLRPAVHQLLQIVTAENAADLPLGAGQIVPEIGLKAVGGEHHGAAAKLAL